jgi:hypothetical protein
VPGSDSSGCASESHPSTGRSTSNRNAVPARGLRSRSPSPESAAEPEDVLVDDGRARAGEHGASGYCREDGHKQIAMTRQLLRRRFARCGSWPHGGSVVLPRQPQQQRWLRSRSPSYLRMCEEIQRSPADGDTPRLEMGQPLREPGARKQRRLRASGTRPRNSCTARTGALPAVPALTCTSARSTFRGARAVSGPPQARSAGGRFPRRLAGAGALATRRGSPQVWAKRVRRADGRHVRHRRARR